jgi:hypothetical protein
MSIPPANANPTPGVPPPPAPNPPFVAGIGPPIIHSNYAEFYADEGVHPRWSPSYAPLLAAMTILPSSTITGRDICQAIEKTQNVQYFTSIGLFGDPAQPTLSRIGVIHRLTYLSAPFLGGGILPSTTSSTELLATSEAAANSSGLLLKRIRLPPKTRPWGDQRV